MKTIFAFLAALASLLHVFFCGYGKRHFEGEHHGPEDTSPRSPSKEIKVDDALSSDTQRKGESPIPPVPVDKLPDYPDDYAE